MSKFAFLLPREELIKPAERIAKELGMDVVLNCSVMTNEIIEKAQECRKLGADILVARGRQASVLKKYTDMPVVEIQLTGLEIALLLHQAKRLVPRVNRPKIGVVTIPNMVGEIKGFEEIIDVEIHTYFVQQNDDMEQETERAIADGMDVILGGDFVNAYCRRLGKRTLFFDSTEESLRTTLRSACTMGYAADAERRNTAHLQVLLDYSFNGIIELDAQGVITRSNDMACKIIQKEREEMIGVSLPTLLSQEDQEVWMDAMQSRKELYFTVFHLAGVYVVANVAPVGGWDAEAGMVFSFYEMHKMERQGEYALRERNRLRRYLAHGRFEDVHYTSREMGKLVRLARIFAEAGGPILICGEVGSGKSLFAESVHNASPNSKGPFVTFDCGTGWSNLNIALSKAAKEADNGTLYLDHLELLPQEGQHILCRLIRENIIYLTEEFLPEHTTVQVIASTSTELSKLEAEGILFPELYYLITTRRLQLPPLRTRKEDLKVAIKLCLDDCVTKLNRYVVLTNEALKVLLNYPWPGNYVQLHTFLESMALMSPSRTIRDGYVRTLLDELYPMSKIVVEEKELTMPVEAAEIAAALSKHRGNRQAAAAELGISKTTLWRRMKQFGI